MTKVLYHIADDLRMVVKIKTKVQTRNGEEYLVIKNVFCDIDVRKWVIRYRNLHILTNIIMFIVDRLWISQICSTTKISVTTWMYCWIKTRSFCSMIRSMHLVWRVERSWEISWDLSLKRCLTECFFLISEQTCELYLIVCCWIYV